MSKRNREKRKNHPDGNKTVESNKIVMIIISLGLLVFLGIIFTGGGSKNSGELIQNVEVRDGVQYIRVMAKGGYSPEVTTAQAGIPTKLIMNTDGTFDCSASLVIRKAGFQGILPPDSETEIDLGTPKVGETFQGLCGMGMYSFEINFS